MIPVKKSQLGCFFKTPLYAKTLGDIGIELYKPANMFINELRLNDDRYPDELFVPKKYKDIWLRELQTGLNKQLKHDLKHKDIAQVRNTLTTLVEETLKEPRSGSLHCTIDTVEILMQEYSGQGQVIRELVNVAANDYTTAIHSINVMALTIGFCAFCDFSQEQTRQMGLGALLHDVGKTMVPRRLLKAPRKLTDAEFKAMQKHTIFGYKILSDSKFPKEICLCALHHHERRDGTGYPDGIANISIEAEIIGMIDCYEAITCNERPYRDSMEAFRALSLIKGELFDGKFNSSVFQDFVKSLG